MMTKRENLMSDISDIKKGLNSDLEEKYKVGLRSLLKKKEEELESLKDEKPAEKKESAPKKAEPKKAEAPKKSPKDALANCKELLAKYTKEKASAKKRVETRKKQGKPAELTPSEAVNKTAKSVKSKVVDMKDKGLSSGEIDKLANGIIATIKSTLAGIKTTTGKHSFLSQIRKEITTIDGGLSKVAMEGGLFADGGMMAKGEYGAYKVTFQDDTEDSLTWSEYAYANSKQQAIQRSAESLMRKYPNYNFGKMKVIEVEEGEKFADGGMTSVGGTQFSQEDLSGFFRKGGYNRGSAWTLDHYQHNKSEKYEVPTSQRKMEEGGMAGQRDLGEYFEKKKYSYEEGGIVDENTEMLLSQVKEIRHHADEIQKLINNNTEVEAWVVAKAERSATDLSDITHYIDGKNQKFADGGMVKWQDVQVGDSANVKSENKTGVIVHTYGRKFHLKFVDGSEKTYDASELEFYKDNEDEFAHGGMVSVGDLVRVKKYGWVMRVVDMDEQSGMYQLENDREGTMNGNAGGYLDSDIESIHTEYARGGYNTGRAWTLDHYQHNKSEDYEKPVGDRKYADGGMMRERGLLNKVEVMFEDPQYNYTTSVASAITEQDARRYFVGKMFDVGSYPNELMKEVVDIRFTKGSLEYRKGGDVAEEKQEIKKIVGEKYEEFVELLGENIKDPKFKKAIVELAKTKPVKYKVIDVPCEKSMPTQKEISMAKSLAFPLTSPSLAEKYLNSKEPIRIQGKTILTCDNGKYIIDGHHRWSQVYLLNPKTEMACTDFYELKNPILGLKATQLGVSADLGYTPTQNVQDINLLTISESELKNFVKEKITPEVRQVFEDNGIKDPEEHIWKNVQLLKKNNKPIKGASKRDFMPQTDDAKNFTDYMPNISKLENGGDTDDDMEVKFIDYKDKMIMYSPYFNKYYTNDIEFDTMDSAKKYIDSGSKNPSSVVNAYREGLFADGGMMANGDGYVVYFGAFRYGRLTPVITEYHKDLSDAEKSVEEKKAKKEKGWKIKELSKMPTNSEVRIFSHEKNYDKVKDFLHSYDKVEKFFEGKDSFYKKDHAWVKPKGYDWDNWQLKKMGKGGVTFDDKVKSISASLLKRKKVSPSVQKDYGKTYSKTEALDSAKRIAGAMRKKEMAKKKA
jgi:hypothetical protein